jgi:hypothetical protein
MKRNFCVYVRALLALLVFLLVCRPGLLFAATSSISSGQEEGGTISSGTSDAYTFDGTSGNTVILRVGATNFSPRIDLYAPGGALMTSAFTANSGFRDTVLYAALTNSGTFTASVSSYYAGGSGTYAVKLGEFPGSFEVPTGEAGGPMTNGATYSGQINLGGFNIWSFSGNSGDSIQLRMGTTNFSPRIDLYGTNGALLSSAFTANTGYRDAALNLRLTNSGTFTVVVSSYYLNYSGGYTLNLAQAPENFVVSPGEQGGSLVNGTRNNGQLGVGNLQMWGFSGNSGDSIQLRMGSTNFSPRIDLYGPNGSLLTSAFTANSGYRDAALSLRLTNSGNFTVVASCYYLNDSGGYSLNLAQVPPTFVVSPGEQGGALANGVNNQGFLGLGDLQMWSFSGSMGNSIQLRMGTTNFSPRLDVYGPDGTLLSSAFTANSGYHDTGLALRLTNSGTFTVVASSYYLNSYGGYSLNLAQIPGSFTISPGQSGGPLTNGFLHQATLGTGALNMWSFSGNAQDNVELRIGTASFSPRLDLYGPDGALLSSAFTANSGYRDAQINLELTNDGTFTLVASSYYFNDSGDYTLTLAHEPGDVQVAPGDQGGLMIDGQTVQGTNVVGDLDVWSFYGTVGDSNVFRFGTVNFTPWLRLYGPNGAQVGEVTSGNSSVRTNFLTYTVTNAGNYTLVSGASFLNQFGTYNLKQSRVPPDLILPGAQIIDEGTTLTVPVSAQDPDDASKTLTFTLVSGPPGAALTTLGPTNASLSWTTTEIDGPSTNTILVTVTDLVLSKPFVRTNTFTVVVNELNTPPVLGTIADKAVDELATLIVTNSATDSDIPINPLSYALLNPPAGAHIDANGVITWTPTEAQGPGTYVITTVVTDTNAFAVNANQMSATNSFSVVVNEINVSPTLPVIGPQTVNELTKLTVTNTASDVDLPPNPLSYRLINPLPGMQIDLNGIITWTPTEAQGPSTNVITTVVTDTNGAAINSRQLSATNAFTVVVNEINTPPVLPAIPDQTVNELVKLTVTNTATDSDLPANPLTYALINPPAGVQIDANGIITWTPTEAQGPITNVITTVVTDTNAFAVNSRQMSTTNSFKVVVNEVNTPPVLPVVAAQTINELTKLTVTNTASDSDLPANPLTYSLINPPAGVQIDANGVITWIPTEAQGPSTNVITTVVTDTNAFAVNSRQMSATNSFTVVVSEVNSAPVLPVIPDQTINELSTLTVTNSAVDSDLPTNPLTYTLINAPAGVQIDANGIITWTPTEAQGPGTATIITVVTDTNAFAVNSRQMSATNSFKVVINEVNSRPQLQPITDRSVHYGTLLAVQAVAFDSDIPTNTLTFSLIVAPTNMTIDAASGLISWTPVLAQFGSNTVTVKVTDNGQPPLSDTTTFVVSVLGQQPQLAAQLLPGHLVQLNISGDVGITYELQVSTNLTSWDNLAPVTPTSTPYPYIDPASSSQPVRYYRLKLTQ